MKHGFGKVSNNHVIVDPEFFYDELKLKDFVICIEQKDYFRISNLIIDSYCNFFKILYSDMDDKNKIKELKLELSKTICD